MLAKNSRMPLSRFWACVFSCSIFALLWTGKMQKTRKWILLLAVFVTVWFVLDPVLNPVPDDFDMMDTDEWFSYVGPVEYFLTDTIRGYLPGDDFDDVASSLSFSLLLLFFLVAHVGSIFAVIYFMFKWVTAYNLDNFGYASKREWKRANSPRRNIRRAISSTVSGAKDKIPYEKIQHAGVKAGTKMTDTARSIRHRSGMGEAEKLEHLKEWHNMMVKGLIDRSEFEKKKADLLKPD